MTLGLRCSEPARRPLPASLPVRFPSVGSLPSASFRFRLPAGPWGSATVAVIGSDWLLSSNEILPMRGPLRAGPLDPLQYFRSPQNRPTRASAADRGSALRFLEIGLPPLFLSIGVEGLPPVVKLVQMLFHGLVQFSLERFIALEIRLQSMAVVEFA